MKNLGFVPLWQKKLFSSCLWQKEYMVLHWRLLTTPFLPPGSLILSSQVFVCYTSPSLHLASCHFLISGCTVLDPRMFKKDLTFFKKLIPLSSAALLTSLTDSLDMSSLHCFPSASNSFRCLLSFLTVIHHKKQSHNYETAISVVSLLFSDFELRFCS